MIKKVISGGQTGADRAALDVALSMGLAAGGWCPAGRLADDGPIDTRYPLQETANIDHTVRTENNVRDSDGSLILHCGDPRGGTAYAIEMARQLHKPVLVVDLTAPPSAEEFCHWVGKHDVQTIHIGGQRESSAPGIYRQAFALISEYLDNCH